MRIGQILHESPFGGGGVQVHVRRLCDDLVARGGLFARLHATQFGKTGKGAGDAA